MSQLQFRLRSQSGFTLLEVIIAMIVAAILGAILLEFMGHTVQKSYEPIKMARENMELNEIVEKMNADYKKRLLLSPDPLLGFKNDVETGNTASPPPYYGDYSVSTAWIAFDGAGQEIPDTNPLDPFHQRILKVTVVRGQHEITTLYTK